MVCNDQQVRRLFRLSKTEETQQIAAAKAGMDPKTARKYLGAKRLPSEIGIERHWRTRDDPFSAVWGDIREQMELNPGLEAKTLLDWLQREYPGRYADGQLRTLQRRIKVWRATEGPAQEVYFSQKHEPGRLCASDFTHMTALGITINGQAFAHLVYHFVLTYSNWETGTVCYSESFESLSEREMLALAISLEEEDERIYADFAEGLRQEFPASAAVFEGMREEENCHRQRLIEL